MSVEKEVLEKEQYIENYIKSMVALEDCIEPFQEQKRDLRKEYIENGWLQKDEIWAAVRAYRLLSKDADFEQLNDMYKHIQKRFFGGV